MGASVQYFFSILSSILSQVVYFLNRMSTVSQFLSKIHFKPEKSQLKDLKKNSNYCFFHDLIVNPCPYRYLQSNSTSLSEEDYINLVNPRTEFYLCKKFEHAKDFQKLPQYVLKRVAYFKPSSKKDELKMKENEIEFKNYDQVATELHSLELGKGSHRMLQLKSIIHQNTRLSQDKRFFYQKLRLPDRRNKQIRNICLILEEMNGGALSEYIMKEHLFTENEIAEYTCQIAEGLIELRSKGIIHRDLRPENILFHNKQIKFADFDAAFIKDYSDYRNIKNGVDRKDTTPYEIMMLMAEQDKKLKAYTAEELYNMQKKADIYFLGVNMYSMIFCQMFESFNHRYINVLTQKKKRQGFNQKLLDLMALCLQKNPDRRIDLPEVISLLTGVQRQFYLKSPQYKRVYLSPQPLNLHSFSSNQIEQKLKSELALQKMKVSHNRAQMDKMIGQALRFATLERNTAYFQNLFRGILPAQDNTPLWYKNSKMRKTVALQVRLQQKIQSFLQKLQIKAYYYEFIYRLLCEVNLACVRSVTYFDNIRSHIQLFSSQLVVILTFIYETIMKRSFTTDQYYEQSNPGYQNRRVICNMRVVHSRWQFFSGRLKLQKESTNHLKQLKKVLQEFNGSIVNDDDLREAQIIEQKHRMKFKSIQRVEKLEQLIMKYRETSYITAEQRLSFQLQERQFMKLINILESNVKKQMAQTIISLILAYQEIKMQQWGHQSNLKNAIFMLMILQAQNTQTICKNDLVLIKEQLCMMINLNLGWNSLQLQAFFSNYTQTHTEEVMKGIQELQSRMHIERQQQNQFKIEINPPQISENLSVSYNSPSNSDPLIIQTAKQNFEYQDKVVEIQQQRNVEEEADEANYANTKSAFDYQLFKEHSPQQKKKKRENILCEIIE